jgi:hypothetical protein
MHHFTVANVNSSNSCTDELGVYFLYQIFLHLYSITIGHFRSKHVACCQTIIMFRKRRQYILAVLLFRFTSTKHIEKSSVKIFWPVFRWFPVTNESRDRRSCGFSCFSSAPLQKFRDSTFTSRSLPSTTLLLHYFPTTLALWDLVINESTCYNKGYSNPVTGPVWPRGFQEV